MGEAGGDGVGEVVIPGHGEHRASERGQYCVRVLVLVPAAAVGEIARCDQEVRRGALDQARQRLLQLPVLARADVQIGDVQDPGDHDRLRL